MKKILIIGVFLGTAVLLNYYFFVYQVDEKYYARGLALFMVNDYQGAIKEWEETPFIERDFLLKKDVYSGLAIAYSLLEQFSNAVVYHKKIVEMRPQDAEANLRMGVSYTQLGDQQGNLEFMKAAKIYFEKAIRLDPKMKDNKAVKAYFSWYDNNQ